jgi:PEP-CTERM motif-containing protein
VFLITGTPPSSGDTTELKYHYVDTNGAKVGDLGSFPNDIQCIGGSCGGGGGGLAVPEPVSFLLAGSGLIGIYFLRRRQAKSR